MENQLDLFKYSDDERTNVFYTQEQAVFQKTEPNRYTTTLSDYRNHILNNFSIKVTLPEIRGRGKASYIKNFSYLYIREFKITIVNRDESRVYLPPLSGYDLYRFAMNMKSVNKHNNKINNIFCKTRVGKNIDSIIFERQELFIHFVLPSDYLVVLPNSQIDIDLELEDDDKILTYNSEFESTSLRTFINESSSTSKNLTLQYSNYIDSGKQDGLLIVFNRVKHEHGTTLAVSNKFDSALRMLVYVNPQNFLTPQKYLMNPGNITSEEELKSLAIDNFKNDLIRTEDTLLLNSQIKYIEIPASGEVKFKRTPYSCKIEILNRPPNKKFYFHSNIMSYCRRHDVISSTNISEYFRKIEVMYTEERLIINVVEHDIPLEILCVPISFWSDVTNTSTGDLRSDESKKNDFYYENKFLTSIDFLNSIYHIDSLTVSIPDRQLVFEAKRNLPALFNNQPNNIFEIPLSNAKKPIKPIPNHFERFQVKINWVQHPHHSILGLYKYTPCIEIVERYTFITNHDRIELKKYSY